MEQKKTKLKSINNKKCQVLGIAVQIIKEKNENSSHKSSSHSYEQLMDHNLTLHTKLSLVY